MTGILDQLGIDPFYIFLILFNTRSRVIVLLVVLYDIYKRLEKRYSVFMKGKSGKDLEKSIFRKFSELDEIAELVKENEVHVTKLSKKIKSQYQKSGIVRYDAFHEMGGNLSFVLTMLDTLDRVLSSMRCTAGKDAILISRKLLWEKHTSNFPRKNRNVWRRRSVRKHMT